MKGFNIFFLIEEHKKWVEEIYSILPKKLRKLIDKKGITINYAPKIFSDENEVAYFIKPNLIEFNKKYFQYLMKKEFFIGILAHELGHFCAHNLNPISRFFYLRKYKKFSEYDQKEKCADFLACKMGFEKEIKVVRENLI